jgi:hypothetical protein
MNSVEKEKIESNAVSEFVDLFRADSSQEKSSAEETPRHSGRLNLDSDNVKNGLAQLVLTLVKFLHELLERQAIRRIDGGSLTDSEIERLGLALMKQAEEIERMRKEFGLEEEDLNLDLGPLGKLM